MLLLLLLASSQDRIQLVLDLRDVTVSGFQGRNAAGRFVCKNIPDIKCKT